MSDGQFFDAIVYEGLQDTMRIEFKQGQSPKIIAMHHDGNPVGEMVVDKYSRLGAVGDNIMLFANDEVGNELGRMRVGSLKDGIMKIAHRDIGEGRLRKINAIKFVRAITDCGIQAGKKIVWEVTWMPFYVENYPVLIESKKDWKAFLDNEHEGNPSFSVMYKLSESEGEVFPCFVLHKGGEWDGEKTLHMWSQKFGMDLYLNTEY